MRRIFIILLFVFALTFTAHAAGNSRERLTKRQVNALIATAKTPTDHERLAAYYRTQADKYLAQSKYHAAMANKFKANPVTSNDKFVHQTVDHCEYYAETLKAQSEKAAALAEQQEQMAQETR